MCLLGSAGFERGNILPHSAWRLSGKGEVSAGEIFYTLYRRPTNAAVSVGIVERR